jgi:hypothetical protein
MLLGRCRGKDAIDRFSKLHGGNIDDRGLRQDSASMKDLFMDARNFSLCLDSLAKGKGFRFVKQSVLQLQELLKEAFVRFRGITHRLTSLIIISHQSRFP